MRKVHSVPACAISSDVTKQKLLFTTRYIRGTVLPIYKKNRPRFSTDFREKVWNFYVKTVSLQHQKCDSMMNEEERLVKILQLSHSQVLDGKSYSQEEAERYLDDRLYEFRDKMVGTCVAEPC